MEQISHTRLNTDNRHERLQKTMAAICMYLGLKDFYLDEGAFAFILILDPGHKEFTYSDLKENSRVKTAYSTGQENVAEGTLRE